MNILLFSSMQANAVVVNILGLLMFLFILLIVFVPEILFRLVLISKRNFIHQLAEFLPIKLKTSVVLHQSSISVLF